MWPGLSRSTLFSAITTGDAEREHALRDEAVARADPLARAEDEEDGVDVLERAVDRALHVLGERVARPLEAGQVGEDELVVVAVRDAEDAPPRRLRLVGDDRDLAAAERVHERRLADVRAAGDGDEAALHAGRSQVSGSSSAGVYVTISPRAFGNVTRSSRNSQSHWRQPPHGDAVIADRLEVARLAAGGDGARDRRLLGADPERIRGVLDVHALEHAAVARPHRRADVVASSTARRRSRRRRPRSRDAAPRPSCEHLEERQRHERAEHAAVGDLERRSGRPTRRGSAPRAAP